MRGRRYGIREQFPRVIEQKRKMLYPVAKEARQNKENKVRLVRDRLFINNKEVNVETDSASEWQRPRNAKKHQEPLGKIPLMTIPHAEVIVYSIAVEERKHSIAREHHM